MYIFRFLLISNGTVRRPFCKRAHFNFYFEKQRFFLYVIRRLHAFSFLLLCVMLFFNPVACLVCLTSSASFFYPSLSTGFRFLLYIGIRCVFVLCQTNRFPDVVSTGHCYKLENKFVRRFFFVFCIFVSAFFLSSSRLSKRTMDGERLRIFHLILVCVEK